MITLDEIKIAYKKLKANVYYDKTQLVLRNAIIEYEARYKNLNKSLEERFENIIDLLNNEDIKNEWKAYSVDILNSINVLYFPKKLKDNNDNAIINDSPEQIGITQMQNFIDIDVEGQILGILWVMKVGRVLDKEIYVHSYGNRIKERVPKTNMESDDQASYSPYLFEPYYVQYESWRDKALDVASEILDKQQDAIILTMDFSRFYYNLHISREEFETYYKLYVEQHEEDRSVERLNILVHRILKTYSCKFDEEGKIFLPIGFFPSNILSNYCLKSFDDGIIERWNPLYYGRYVDDIIVVDKVEKNSLLYTEAKKGELKNEFVMEYFLCNCNADKKVPCFSDADTQHGLLVKSATEIGETIYAINPNLLCNSGSTISVQNKKVKVFYFKSSGSRSLLDGFRKALYENTSEFRYLPEDDAVLLNNDYSEVFDLKNSDTINKLRGVESINIDKYAMSKFLGKLMRIGELINDSGETQFEKDILKIFDNWNIIDNYTTWEKVIQILALNGRFSMMHKYIMRIIKAITNIQLDVEEQHTISMKKSLFLHLHSALSRGLSLIWGDSAKKFITDICNDILKYMASLDEVYDIVDEYFDYDVITKYRGGYCYSRMCDKYALIAPIDFLIYRKVGRNLKYKKLTDEKNANLTKFNDFMRAAEQFSFSKSYCYYPYIITPQDLSFSKFLSEINSIAEDKLFLDSKSMNQYIHSHYVGLNFNTEKSVLSFEETEVCSLKNESGALRTYGVKVGSNKNSSFNIAIANVALKNSDFIKVLEGTSNRTYKRYRELSHVFNEALRENADMLIFPESYLPIEWLPTVTRTCAKNQIALITGIEHFIINKHVFNFTATILPYMKDDFQFAHISYHLKVHYSPEEERQIKGYRLTPVEGKTYELFNWNDLWFSVYCCFELASISDRSIFKNYPDMFVAVEWNKDTIYFSNVIESLCRDMHCYCVQVNSSDYGDSRIVQPSDSATRDIVKTKGGINSTVLVANIDVNKLRAFQRKEYELQKDNKIFKPTPPQFDKDIIVKKIKGRLWSDLIKSVKR